MAFQGLGSWPQSILILFSMRLLMFTVVENTAHKLQSCAKFMACGSKTRAWNLKRRNKTHLKPQSPQKQYLCATILLQLLIKISLFSHHKCGTAASQRGCINKFRQALTFNSTMYSLSTVVWKHLYNPLLKYLKYLSEQEKITSFSSPQVFSGKVHYLQVKPEDNVNMVQIHNMQWKHTQTNFKEEG